MTESAAHVLTTQGNPCDICEAAEGPSTTAQHVPLHPNCKCLTTRAEEATCTTEIRGIKWTSTTLNITSELLVEYCGGQPTARFDGNPEVEVDAEEDVLDAAVAAGWNPTVVLIPDELDAADFEEGKMTLVTLDTELTRYEFSGQKWEICVSDFHGIGKRTVETLKGTTGGTWIGPTAITQTSSQWDCGEDRPSDEPPPSDPPPGQGPADADNDGEPDDDRQPTSPPDDVA